eukprot:4700902-Alexandrium_andersonii.AAC.1
MESRRAWPGGTALPIGHVGPNESPAGPPRVLPGMARVRAAASPYSCGCRKRRAIEHARRRPSAQPRGLLQRECEPATRQGSPLRGRPRRSAAEGLC